MKNLRTFRVEIVAILAIVIMQVGLYLALRSFISMGRGLVIGKVTEVSKEEHRQSEIIATIIERQTMNRASILETNRLVKELIYATTQSAAPMDYDTNSMDFIVNPDRNDERSSVNRLCFSDLTPTEDARLCRQRQSAVKRSRMARLGDFASDALYLLILLLIVALLWCAVFRKP